MLIIMLIWLNMKDQIQVLKAPTCYKAIRTPVFHFIANRLTSRTVFVPNFMNFIATKVINHIENEESFDFMAQQHRCISPTSTMSPLKLQLEVSKSIGFKLKLKSGKYKKSKENIR